MLHSESKKNDVKKKERKVTKNSERNRKAMSKKRQIEDDKQNKNF